MQNRCAEIKLRAERRGGEILSKTLNHSGGRPSKKGCKTQPFSLDEIGIEKTASHRWQKLAAVPEPKFERFIFEANEEKRELTTADALAAIQPLCLCRRALRHALIRRRTARSSDSVPR